MKRLGLAAVAGIVQNHGGCVSYESNPERTTFHILLPKAHEKGINPENEILNHGAMTSGLNLIH